MAITATNQVRTRTVTTVSVISDLTPAAGGDVYYHWYIHGVYVGWSTSPRRSFGLADGVQARIDCNDTTDPDYDAAANAPAGYPPVRTIHWTRSIATDVAKYRVDQRTSSSDWTALETVSAEPGRWQYSVVTAPLDDLMEYSWRVVPIDEYGNEGIPLEIDTETVVRTPDAPNFTVTYDSGTDKMTFAEAA